MVVVVVLEVVELVVVVGAVKPQPARTAMSKKNAQSPTTDRVILIDSSLLPSGMGGPWMSMIPRGLVLPENQPGISRNRSVGGDDRSRTGVAGFADPCLSHSATSPRIKVEKGADEGIRTLDLLHGKQTL